MAYQKTVTSIVPLEHDQDVDTLRWLQREAAERIAERDALTVLDYRELGEIPFTDLPPKASKQMPNPLSTYRWFKFEAVLGIDPVTVEWLTAESDWQRRQYRDWLHQETLWRNGSSLANA